jgi:hypothetical protein
MIENRMIKTRAQILFPKRERARARMIANEPKFKVTAYDSRERRTTHTMKFITQYEAENYLNRMTIKRNNRHYHKNEKGMLDMELEYTLRK